MWSLSYLNIINSGIFRLGPFFIQVVIMVFEANTDVCSGVCVSLVGIQMC